MAVQAEHGSFISSKQDASIVYTKWIDNKTEPKAILLIAHGMAEYVGRYADFAVFMSEKGYAVYGNDHLGHGKTAGNTDNAGYFAEKDGRNHVVDDMQSLCRTARKDYPGLPVILMGHSMGSFVARVFCSRYSREIDGAIFMGTSGRNPAAGAGVAIVNLISLFKGEKHRSAFIDNMAFGGYNKKYDTPKTRFDWLNTDEAEVQKYIDDEMCGYLFTLSGYRELFKLLGEATKKGWADNIRKDLPILVISGAQDPVGDFGKGPQQTFDDLHGSDLENVALLLYDDMRHEILNEKEKHNVYDDIAGWCDEAITQEK